MTAYNSASSLIQPLQSSSRELSQGGSVQRVACTCTCALPTRSQMADRHVSRGTTRPLRLGLLDSLEFQTT